MFTEKVSALRDSIHALLCYQMFITPLPNQIEKEYEFFAKCACDFLKNNRTDMIKVNSPRPYVIHHFANPNKKQAKKILVTHGWMSRAAYMVRIIRALHKEGYEIYALDFPAHGEAKGWQLPWVDAVDIIRDTLNSHGPFYGVVGHSFGGAMLLVTLTLASQSSRWRIEPMPKRAILLASPTSPRTPIKKLARRFKLRGSGLMLLKKVINERTNPELQRINFRRLMRLSKVPVLCIHGQEDKTVDPLESIRFCQENPNADLILFPEVDHVGILIDERIEKRVCHYFASVK